MELVRLAVRDVPPQSPSPSVQHQRTLSGPNFIHIENRSSPDEPEKSNDPKQMAGPQWAGLATYALGLAVPFFLVSPAVSFFLMAGRAKALLSPPAMAFHLP